MSDFEAKLQHLTVEQVERLYNDYLGGEKIALLIERYAIDGAKAARPPAFSLLLQQGDHGMRRKIADYIEQLPRPGTGAANA